MSTKTDARDQGPEADCGRRSRRAVRLQVSTAPREEALVTLPRHRRPRLGALVQRRAHLDAVALMLLFLLARCDPRLTDPADQRRRGEGADVQGRSHHRQGVYDKLGLFDVYSSVWFSAIYILLFVSLIGCIVPRTCQFIGQLRSRPPAAPKRLYRLPA